MRIVLTVMAIFIVGFVLGGSLNPKEVKIKDSVAQELKVQDDKIIKTYRDSLLLAADLIGCDSEPICMEQVTDKLENQHEVLKPQFEARNELIAKYAL